MIRWLQIVICLAFVSLKSRRNLLLENLPVPHQVLVLSRHNNRPPLTPVDRALWAWLSGTWTYWKSRLGLVQPNTVVRWQRQGFRLFWRWKSRSRSGRQTLNRDTIDLIRQMSRTNPLWGAPRIHGELLKLGIHIAQRSVAKYMIPRSSRPTSPTWKTFLRNHLSSMISIDFFTVPTLRFQILNVFIVLSHCRRRVLHFNVVDSPSARWPGQQLREAFPFTFPPKYLLRDRDGIYGLEFQTVVASLGFEELRTAPRSPWQSPYVERLIGSIRRKCLDHVIIFAKAHWQRLLSNYFDYYHQARTHLGLKKDVPEPRPSFDPDQGAIVAFPEVGGLHHRYERRAA